MLYELKVWEVLGTQALDVASLGTTRESGMRSINNLESIQESSSIDSHFDTFSQAKRKMGTNTGINQETMHKRKFDDLGGEMEFKVVLTFQSIWWPRGGDGIQGYLSFPIHELISSANIQRPSRLICIQIGKI